MKNLQREYSRCDLATEKQVNFLFEYCDYSYYEASHTNRKKASEIISNKIEQWKVIQDEKIADWGDRVQEDE